MDTRTQAAVNAPVDWEQVARLAIRSRRLDDFEEAELAPSGEVPYQFSARGHELAQLLLARQLTHPHDAATVYYRSRPFLLACGLTMAEALAAGMGRTGSPSEGRDVGVVFSLPPRSGPTILPASGDVGAQYTPAAGWAQAVGYRARSLGQADWSDALAVALGGDGSVATNGFWSALTMATTLQLPMLFFIEDNGYGLSVPSRLQTPGGDIARNLESFEGLLVLQGSGSDLDGTAALIEQAVGHVRRRGPCLLRLTVPRLSGHTFIDNQAYKSAAEREDEARRDPLAALAARVPRDVWVSLEAEAESEVRQAVEMARALSAPAGDAVRHLFYEGTPQLVGGLLPEAEPRVAEPAGTAASHPARRLNLIEAVRLVLEQELAANPRCLVFGEDVGLKGGVHGATAGMQARFGADRVFDTSLSEEGIIGRAVGMALAGLLPVPEIQFRKYADPATESINDTGTLRWRTAGKFAAPMVVRIPVGHGRKTGDPWHSVSGEAIYAHTLGWRLAIPSNAADAAGLLRSALRGQDPVLFFEHRALLDAPAARRLDPGADYLLPFGVAANVQPGDSLTLVTWGAMVYPSLEAAAHHPGRVEVLDLRTIVPWDREAVLTSVRRTGRCLVVHEDTLTAGFAGEILAVVAAEAFTRLDAPPRRLATPDCPIPYSAGLMAEILPGSETIGAAIAELLAF
ncbi:MAG TPA: transketolase C-terminal domain-containing protein [Anaerolineales bacterium]|nr:transketolase C-terminal domain-containing protein [Anaerolineales bacterium]